MNGDAIFHFFPTVFNGFTILFSSPAFLYLLGIFFLAFVLCLIKELR